MGTSCSTVLMIGIDVREITNVESKTTHLKTYDDEGVLVREEHVRTSETYIGNAEVPMNGSLIDLIYQHHPEYEGWCYATMEDYTHFGYKIASVSGYDRVETIIGENSIAELSMIYKRVIDVVSDVFKISGKEAIKLVSLRMVQFWG